MIEIVEFVEMVVKCLKRALSQLCQATYKTALILLKAVVRHSRLIYAVWLASSGLRMRNFTPNRLGVSQAWFASVIEKRLMHSGEYVYHLPSNGERQAVVMNYQYLPRDDGINQDYVLVGTNPTLYGYLDHFATPPTLFQKGNSVRKVTGSQFEVRGILYNVKRVDVNHRGYVCIELVQDENCAEPRPEFKAEMDSLLCDPTCETQNCKSLNGLAVHTADIPCEPTDCEE